MANITQDMINRSLEHRIKIIQTIDDFIHLIEEMGVISIDESIKEHKQMGASKVFKNKIFTPKAQYHHEEYDWSFETDMPEHILQIVKKENINLYKQLLDSHAAIKKIKDKISTLESALSKIQSNSENYVKTMLAQENLSILLHSLEDVFTKRDTTYKE